MKYWKIIPVFMLLASFISCGGGNAKSEENEKSEPMVSVTKEKISGPLGKYFAVEKKDYKITNDYSDKVYFEIKRISEGMPEPWTEGTNLDDWDVDMDITVQFFDESGMVVEKTTLNLDRDELIALDVNESSQFDAYIDNGEKVKSVKFGSTFKMTKATDSDDADADMAENLDKATDILNASVDAMKSLNDDEDIKKATKAVGASVKALKAMSDILNE